MGGVVFFYELDALHEAGAADVADVGGGQRGKGVTEDAGGGADLAGGVGIGVKLEGGEGHGAAYGVAEEGAGVEGFAGGLGPCVHDIGAAHAGGYGEAVGEGLAEANDVRGDVEVVAGEEFAGAVEAGEDFVGDEEDFFLVADAAEEWEEVAGRWDDAAAALDGLDEDGADLALADGGGDLIVDGCEAGGCTIWKGVALDAEGLADAEGAAEAVGIGDECCKVLELRMKGAAEVGDAGGGDGTHAEAVIGAGEGDDAGAAAVEEGGLEGGLDGV